jgi:hypothetical protein
LKSEFGDEPLIFVLKMDEAEIVKQQKLEKTSITLMNRALKRNADTTAVAGFDFLVQSENEIWPISSFEVYKESHDCLKWMFDKTSYPTVVKAQNGGQSLVVDGIGEFKVEWHMSCDMKTVKCLYGMSHGALATHSCIYCCQERATPTVSSIDSPAKRTWKGGLFSRSIAAKPVRGLSSVGLFDPIFDIPMTCVHICMLHAQVNTLMPNVI